MRTATLIFATATLLTHLISLATTLEYWTSLEFQDSWAAGGFLYALLDLSLSLGIVGPILLLIGLVKGGKNATIVGSIVTAVRFVFFYIAVNVYIGTAFAEIGADRTLESYRVPVLDFFGAEPAEPFTFYVFMFSLHLAFITGALGLISQRGGGPASSSQTVRLEDTGSTQHQMSERITTMTETKFCSGCGQPATEAKFCANCGTPSGGAPAVNVGVTQNAIPKTNTLAIVSLVLSFFVPIVGMILAYSARKEIDASNGLQTGRGLTTGAIVLNWFWIVSLVFIVLGTGALLSY